MARDRVENDERYRILRVALEMMGRTGYDGLSVRELCREAGISTGKFYYHFGGKADLLTFCFEDAIERFQQEVLANADWSGRTPAERLTDFYVWFMRHTIDEYGFDFVAHFYRNDNELLADGPGYSNAIISLTEEILVDALQEGWRPPEGRRLRELASDACVVVKGCIFQWCVKRGSFDLPEYVGDLLSRVLPAIL